MFLFGLSISTSVSVRTFSKRVARSRHYLAFYSKTTNLKVQVLVITESLDVIVQVILTSKSSIHFPNFVQGVIGASCTYSFL